MVKNIATFNNCFSAYCPQHNQISLNINYDTPYEHITNPGISSPPVTVARGYRENTTATVVCEEGLISVGYTTTVTCTRSRNWSDILSPEACCPGNRTKYLSFNK